MNIHKIDLNYSGVEIEYDYLTNCEQNGCEDDGICRCGEIVNEHITNIDIPKIVKKIYDNYYGNIKTISEKRDSKISEVLSGVGKDINLYCVDRIVKKYKLWEVDYYSILKSHSYYGEEIDGIFLHQNISKKIEYDLEFVNNLMSLKEKIEYLLLLEYGSILPELTNCNYSIEEIEKSKINFGSIKHYEKVKDKSLEFYSDALYDNIRGVVIERDNDYKLIDGYHRTHMTKNEYVKFIVIRE